MTYEDALKINPNVTRVVVCAANKYGNLIIPGPRHYDPTMRNLISLIPPEFVRKQDCEQGFIDQWGKFMTREEALDVAKENGQYGKNRTPSHENELFSEDLY